MGFVTFTVHTKNPDVLAQIQFDKWGEKSLSRSFGSWDSCENCVSERFNKVS